MIQKLWIKSFRNLSETTLEFGDKTHFFIYGNNNQGKTNFLESIYFLSHGKSPLDATLREIIPFGLNAVQMGMIFSKNEESHRVYVKQDENRIKQITLDQTGLKSFLGIQKQVTIFFISADIIRLFKDSPEVRRRDLDQFCSQLFPEYSAILRRYERVTKQKNRALKEERSFDVIQVWNKQLVELAGPIIQYRHKALMRLKTELEHRIIELDPDFKSLKGLYCAKSIEGYTLETYSSILSEKLAQNIEKERVVGYCLYGPHRDDFEFELNGKRLFDFYSRGINRATAFLYKITQLLLLAKTKDQRPVLLLDDVFAELDRDRKTQLMGMIKPVAQIFYTSVLEEDKELCSDFKWYKMVSGKIIDEVS